MAESWGTWMEIDGNWWFWCPESAWNAVDMGMCLENLLGWIIMYYWEKHWALGKNQGLWVEIDWNRWEWSVQREPKVWFMQWTWCASTETILDMKQSVFECTCKPRWKANKDQSNGGSNGSRKLLELATLMPRCHVQQKQACHQKTLFVHLSRYYWCGKSFLKWFLFQCLYAIL